MLYRSRSTNGPFRLLPASDAARGTVPLALSSLTVRATKWSAYDQGRWYSADHILRQLLYRDHPHDVRRLQPRLEESGLGHDHSLSDQPAAVRRDAGQGRLSRY